MHMRNDDAPYHDACDAMHYWPRTATASAVRRTAEGLCDVAAPLGLEDVFSLTLMPTH